MINVANNVRVRMAPSPTGNLHVGGLRAAFFNWLFAKHNNGTFLIRIEDTDLERSKAEYTASILESFKWVGISSDEPLVIQSTHINRHLEVANKMLNDGTAYPCYCTAQELEQRLGSNAANEGGYVKYDRHCRNLKDKQAGKSFAIRFKIPDNISNISFRDIIRGDINFELDQFDDFIIVRSDNTPMYNFVVVIDDADMAITHVIRGEEHIANTPKQILLYQACEFKIPEFAHLPLILGPDGQKLSKRHAATAVIDYKNKGFLASALCNYLVRLGWSHGDQEVFELDEMIKFFSLEDVGKKAAIFDIKKLEWLNGLYIRKKVSEQLIELIIQDVDNNFLEKIRDWEIQKINKAIDLYKERVKTLVELIDEIEGLYIGPYNILAQFKNGELQEFEFLKSSGIKEHIIAVKELLHNYESLDVQILSNDIKSLCKKLNIELPAIAKPIRVALVGKTNSPGIFELLALLGKDESIKRLDYLIESI